MLNDSADPFWGIFEIPVEEPNTFVSMAAPRKGTSCAGMVNNPTHCVISQQLRPTVPVRSLGSAIAAMLLFGLPRSSESAETLRGLSLVNFGSPTGLSPLGLSDI
ncbi:hypothetical protein FB451DRAFT_1172778 [Mycena latifolia]|nr:hypothetical protein FB451DRAFT_1172778 [Mycena latifolia]